MSGGGTNTVQSSAPPPQVLDAYVNATNNAQNVASTPFQTPQAPVAGLSAQQQQGINEVAAAQGVANPYINQANQFIAQSNAPLNGAQPYQTAATQDLQAAQEYNPAAALVPYANQATGLYSASAAPVTAGQVQAGQVNAQQVQAGQVNAQQVSPTQFSAGQLNQYLSPYNNDVINATQAEFNNQNAQQQQGVVGNAISAGAWGGDRSAVAQGITAGQQQLAEAPVIAGLENQNYSQALGEFNTQQQQGLQAQEANQGANLTAQQLNQATGLQGQEANQSANLQGQLANQQTGLQGQEANQSANLQALEASRGLQQSAASGIAGIGGLTAQQQTAEQNAALGISAANLNIGQQALGAQEAQGWLASQGAYASANLGNEVLNSDLSEANADIGAGSLTQTQEQAELNAPYEEQLAQLAYPFQTSQFLTNSVEGLGAGQGGTATTTNPGPSTGSQVAGLATSALGIAAIAGLLKDGGAVKRAGGGIVPGAATNVPGMGSGISGVVNIVPNTSGTSVHGMGPPAPPPAQQQPNEFQGLNNTIMNIGMMKNHGGGGGGGMAAAGPDPMAQEAAGNAGEYGITSGEGEGMGLMAAAKRGGGIPRLGIGGMVHMPVTHAFKPPHMGSGIAGGHAMFHPPGLKLAPGGSIDVSQPDQTSQEVQMQNAGQDEANAMAVAMATGGTGIAPMMNTPTAQARGGGVARRADGGAVDDGAWDSDSPPVTISGSPSDTTGNTLGVGGPPAPPSPEAQQGAVQTSVTPASGNSGIGGSGNKAPSNSDIWKSLGPTLLASGLGMLGGSSPYAGVNIGRGGLEGLQFGESIKNREENVALRQAQQDQTKVEQQQNDLYRQGMLKIAGQKADTGADRAQTYAMLSNASASQKTADAAYLTAKAAMGSSSHASEGDIRAQAIKSLVGTTNPDTGQPWTPAEAYRYTGGFDIREKNANTSAKRADTSANQGAQRINLQAQGLELRREAYQHSASRADQAAVDKATDADLARAASLSNASKDINGNIVLNFHDALGKVMAERPNAAPAPAGVAAAPASPAALADPLGIR